MALARITTRQFEAFVAVADELSFAFAGERLGLSASAVSQLIAEREHLATQRVKRQATPLEVLRVYDAGGKLKTLRIPPGYRTNIEA